MLELFLLSCKKSTRITTWKWKGKRFGLPHSSKFWKGVALWWSIYENNRVIYSFINVLKNPKMHMLDSWRCIMVEFMFAYVIKAILVNVFVVNYVILICDKVNIMDNDNWISIHAYVMQNCVKVPMLIFLQRVVVEHGLIIWLLWSWKPYKREEAWFILL